ncbi:hypothetical protein E2C01_031125 [Portunus trituberculatus]|uniref:Secreted protein n=1 Tax=Portunus trituberculatus TaxID=210409 RepID=A0A5B7EWU0_PORTR|nr:hypothetical protein [Portunus trituberculatus]
MLVSGFLFLSFSSIPTLSGKILNFANAHNVVWFDFIIVSLYAPPSPSTPTLNSSLALAYSVKHHPVGRDISFSVS